MKLDSISYLWTILCACNMVYVENKPLARSYRQNQWLVLNYQMQKSLDVAQSGYTLRKKRETFKIVKSEDKILGKVRKSRVKRDMPKTGKGDETVKEFADSSSNTKNSVFNATQRIWPKTVSSDPDSNSPSDVKNIEGVDRIMKLYDAKEIIENTKTNSLLQLLMSSPEPGATVTHVFTPATVTVIPFKKNPPPKLAKGKRCNNCPLEFIPVFEDINKNEPILPEVNLNIVPLGAILTFIFILCCKCFSWALEDIREWDEKHVQIVRPKYNHSKKDDPCFESQMSRRRSVKKRNKRRMPNLWRRSSCRVEPEVGTLKYVASRGLLPGLSFRNSRFYREEDEEVTWPLALKGTSPVASTSIAAAMAANIPMCIACTHRQMSSESRASSNGSNRRPSRVERRGSQQVRRKSKASSNYDGPTTRSNSRSSSKSGSKSSLKYSSSQSSIRHQRQILANLTDMSCSAPYIPDSMQSLSAGGEFSRRSSCAESIPLMRTKSAKSSAVKIDSASIARQQWQRAALLLQQSGGHRLMSSRHRSTGSTGTSRSGSAQSSQATSLSSLRLLSQTTGSTSNVDSDLTSQTNLTSEAGSEVNTTRPVCSDVHQYTLPKPTWPTTRELRGSYYEDPMFIDWGYLHPMAQYKTSPKCSPSSLNVESRKNSGRISDLSSFQNSSNASQTNLNSEVSESDHSAPSSPASSSHGSTSSSLSPETTVSRTNNIQNQSMKSSSNDSNNTDNNENLPSIAETCDDNSTNAEHQADENKGFSEKVIQTRSKSADELETKKKEDSNIILGIYDPKTDSMDNKDVVSEDMCSKPAGEALSKIALMKSKMSLPLVKVSDKNYTYLRPRCKTFSHLHKNGGIDGHVLMAKLNDIVKKESSSPKKNPETRRDRQNGHLIDGWMVGQEALTVISDDGDLETQV